jgi:hypothetical protein
MVSNIEAAKVTSLVRMVRVFKGVSLTKER